MEARAVPIASPGKPPGQLCIDTIRTLAMDAVQQANSGHPGTPMGMAPVIYCLWQQFLRFDPEDPIWPNRDRFVLSIGHASILLYSMLHLCGGKAVDSEYERLGELCVKPEGIKQFRQLESKCPGHPEYRWRSGIETTTGPWGKVLPRVLGWRLPNVGWPTTSTARALKFSISTCTRCAATVA
jgi:transketolase